MHQIEPQPTPRPYTPKIRESLVASIRQQIADGTYETQAKLDVAVERLFRAVVGRSTAQG